MGRNPWSKSVKTNQTIMVSSNYGPLKRGQEYIVVTEGHDHFLVRCQGKPVYVPRHLITYDNYNEDDKNAQMLREMEEYLEEQEER